MMYVLVILSVRFVRDNREKKPLKILEEEFIYNVAKLSEERYREQDAGVSLTACKSVPVDRYAIASVAAITAYNHSIDGDVAAHRKHPFFQNVNLGFNDLTDANLR